MSRVVALVLALAGFVGLTYGAQAAPVSFTATLDGPSESPPNASPGIGTALVEFDIVTHTLHVVVSFSGLIGTVTAAHIHTPTAVAGAGTAGVATTTPTFLGFPAGVTAGSFDATFDTTLATSFNPTFVTAQGGTVALAEAALFASMLEGRSYFNIHTTSFGGGEIRGFLQPVPEPSTVALFGLGLAGIAFAAGQRRKARARRA